MSRRKTAAARAARRSRPIGGGSREVLVAKRSGTWWVRSITGATSTKDYRCGGCDQLIRPATPHVVVWPEYKSLLATDAIDERRHWHSACWERHS